MLDMVPYTLLHLWFPTGKRSLTTDFLVNDEMKCNLRQVELDKVNPLQLGFAFLYVLETSENLKVF